MSLCAQGAISNYNQNDARELMRVHCITSIAWMPTERLEIEEILPQNRLNSTVRGLHFKLHTRSENSMASGSVYFKLFYPSFIPVWHFHLLTINPH